MDVYIEAFVPAVHGYYNNTTFAPQPINAGVNQVSCLEVSNSSNVSSNSNNATSGNHNTHILVQPQASASSVSCSSMFPGCIMLWLCNSVIT